MKKQTNFDLYHEEGRRQRYTEYVRRHENQDDRGTGQSYLWSECSHPARLMTDQSPPLQRMATEFKEAGENKSLAGADD